MVYALGLTGGISSGKSLASEFLSPYFEVVDADHLVHELYQVHKGLQDAISRDFGSHVVNENGVNRKVLRGLVFDNPEKLRALNQLVHPVVREELLKRVTNARENRVPTLFAIPLLFENSWQERLDRTLLIHCSEETQLLRLLKRDRCSLQEAKRIIAAQMPLCEKLELCDDQIANDGTQAELKENLETWYRTIYRRLLKNKENSLV